MRSDAPCSNSTRTRRQMGGSISAEHGIGQMKLDEFERLAPPGRIAALKAIKHALDPSGLMNPGKLVR